MLEEQRRINGFKQGDIVKIKPEWLEKGEEDHFHVVKIWHKNCLGLTQISLDNTQTLFPCITDTRLECVDPKIYGNAEDNEYTEEFANTPLA